jgi:calcium-dependent phosphoinositide phospholipase C
VRTMTDGGAQAVRAGDSKRRDLAIRSGAQILSTDYPFDWKAEGAGYHVTLGDEKVRCNPVNAPKACIVKSPY